MIDPLRTALRKHRDLAPDETYRWVPPVLLLLLAVTAAVGVAAGAAATSEAVGIALADAVFTVLVVSPLLYLALRGRAGAARTVLTLLLLIAASRWALSLPRVGPFADLEWNWQGKTVELLWLAVLFAVLWTWARREVGLRRGVLPGSGAPVARVVIGVFLASTLLILWALVDEGAAADPVTLERLLFDSGHANLTEELLVRGAMLAVLDRICGTPWRFFGAQVGWGLVLTTVWFGLWHGLVLTDSGLLVDPGAVLSTALAGLLLGWVRARSGSIWLAFVAHCAPEWGMSAAGMIYAAMEGAPVLV